MKVFLAAVLFLLVGCDPGARLLTKNGNEIYRFDIKDINFEFELFTIGFYQFDWFVTVSNMNDTAVRSCSSVASRSLSLSGAFGFGLHPYLLHRQMYLRSLGVSPSMFSYHAY